MYTYRNVSYRKHWDQLIDAYGVLCFYCRSEMATSIDHVTPYAWDGDNSIENLVPACGLCNSLAGDKVFESVEHKRQYIMAHRKHKSNRRAICISCLLPYEYRVTSPSLFLCAECYDEEYSTAYSTKRVWCRWVKEPAAAGILAEAHRMAKRKRGPAAECHIKRQWLYALISAYEKLTEDDPELIRFLAF